ncbi:hypothetical protein SUGI_0639050 [Cryptomeria japonica]|uniref:PAN domain-containing protein At5g03700 n=1 Tax=Cryptomeria japonica TaxID=3369 RepID=UPI0024147501|nr:PAN domain-containing protein At5g03700 [Cryptomeria japonica]GLJ31768.1 hypothetical protein SUGI_0639050 [Cryptomeria japonica]
MEIMKNQWLLVALAVFCGLAEEVECYYKSRMPNGFSISPAGKDQFQPILLSPSGDFALGFYRVEKDHFLLSVAFLLGKDETKINATDIVWSANATNTVRENSEFMQDASGSVALLDERGIAVWRVQAAPAPAVVALLDSGNLQVKTEAAVEWQSFDYPTDTLLEAQNFTASMRVVAAGEDYTLQMEAAGMALTWKSGQVYWRRKAMQEKALIIPEKGPIYARLESDGYIAMYQSESQLVDVNPLDTYHQKLRVRRRLKLEADGNLRAYYWRDEKRFWEVDFQALETPCQLPSTCGPYAICGRDTGCTCLSAGGAAGCLKAMDSALFCSQTTALVRITGVDLPYSEFAPFVRVDSEQGCMDLCGGTCGCSAALFYNDSKRCYQVPAPLPTLVQQPTQDKVAFIKFLNTTNNERRSRCRSSKCKAVLILGCLAVVVGGLAALGACVMAIWGCKLQEGKREIYIAMSEKFMAALPYKNLNKDEAA